MKLQITKHNDIILSVGMVSRPLTRLQLITLMGYTGALYHNETSLFYAAYEVVVRMEDRELLEFLVYTDEDWDNMLDYVEELYDFEPETVYCRNN